MWWICLGQTCTLHLSVCKNCSNDSLETLFDFTVCCAVCLIKRTLYQHVLTHTWSAWNTKFQAFVCMKLWVKCFLFILVNSYLTTWRQQLRKKVHKTRKWHQGKLMKFIVMQQNTVNFPQHTVTDMGVYQKWHIYCKGVNFDVSQNLLYFLTFKTTQLSYLYMPAYVANLNIVMLAFSLIQTFITLN